MRAKAGLKDVQKTIFASPGNRQSFPGRAACRLAIVLTGKTVPLTLRGGAQGSATSRLTHFLHNCLTDGGEVVSFTHWSADFYPQDDCWYFFLLEAASTPGPYCGWKDYVNGNIQ
jgi:hypothetical protein